MKDIKNSVQIIGNVGKAPEIRELQDGKKVARFSVATNENYKNSKGESVKNTTWHNFVAWGGMAAYIERHVAKGSQVAVEGKLSNRSYQDSHGEKRTVTEIIVNELLFTVNKFSKPAAK